MRSATAAIIRALTGVLIICSGSAAQEMLSNPLLEPDDARAAPRGWMFRGWNTDSEALYDPTGGREGTPAAGIRCPTAQDRGCWAQVMPLEGRRHLHVSGYYRTEGISRGDGATVRIAWRDADRRFMQNTHIRLPPSEGWTIFDEVVTAPEGAENIDVELFNFFRAGTVWWDRAAVREATREELLRFDDTPARAGEWGFRPEQGDVSAVNPPAFVWRLQNAAVGYELQVGADEDFSALAYEARVARYNAHCPPTTLPPGEYRWRVRFVDAEDHRSAWSRVREFSIPDAAARFPLPAREDLLARVPQAHPRLFVRPEELPWLRETARGPLQARWEGLLAQCERLLESPPPTEDYPKYPEGTERLSPEWARIWRGARSYVERSLNGAATLGLVWRLGGPEEYGQAGRKLLMEVAQWDPLGATGYRYNDEAGMRYAWGFSRAYTMLYDLLTEEEREKCREVMKIRGDEMYRHLHTQRQHLWNPYSSHPNRAYHWLGEIGIAFLGEIPEAGEWAWFATNVFFNTYPVWSDDDGGWHEGVHYWSGYLGRITLWLDVMRAAFDVNGYDKPFFGNVGYFPIYSQPPNAPRLVFGDTTGVRRPQNVRALMSEFATQTGNPYWADYVERLGGPVARTDYIGLIRAARALERPPVERASIADLPTARLFGGTGLAFMHTNLADALGNVQVSFKSSPFGSQSHGNEANNSFELYAHGDALLVRSGTREIHGSPHHRGWTWQTHSCNAITVNDRGQIAHSAAAVGRIRAFESAPGYHYVVGEAADSYPEALLDRADRHMLFVKPELLVVYDVLEAPEPATFQYYLHSPHPFEGLAGGPHGLGVAGERGECRLSFLAPTGLRLTQTEGFDPPLRAPYDEQIHEYHLKAETVDAAERMQFVTLYWAGPREEVPEGRAEHRELEGGHAVRAALTDGEAIILLRSGPGALEAWGLDSDGAVAAVRLDREGRLVDFFAAGGATVRWNGRILRDGD